MATYIGYNTVDNDFRSVTTTDTELIKRDLINHFSIRRGEKLMNGNFGSNLIDLVMEPMTDSLQELILDEVNQVFDSDPRIRVTQLLVDEYENGIQLQVSLIYVNSDQSENMVINFNRQDGTIS